MPKLKAYNTPSGTVYQFRCPGCDAARHSVNATWKFNGNMEAPTFSPSILVTGGGDSSYRCHSFVEDGKIRFLQDCSHTLAGKTVDLPEWTD